MFTNLFRSRKRASLIVEFTLLAAAFISIFITSGLAYFFLFLAFVYFNRFIEKPAQRSSLINIAIFFAGFLTLVFQQ
ncbi:hypothetical protein BEP19_00230 [Ammoniphilus oxalaticus]|uniref:Uncharacterized protein n=1 Tax=Ammoniphilus oxalaticus TaxID=66863 RepID=A0A419SRD6_9BACL|nr:hypothetical protein [Ammoniphilus oxalaticus]RKD27037.1 hypothetical protein BEP19_00230 [Ammoniphilus oxalaticus]